MIKRGDIYDTRGIWTAMLALIKIYETVQNKKKTFECEKHFLNWSNITGNCIYTIEGRTLKGREKANFVLTSNAD